MGPKITQPGVVQYHDIDSAGTGGQVEDRALTKVSQRYFDHVRVYAGLGREPFGNCIEHPCRRSGTCDHPQGRRVRIILSPHLGQSETEPGEKAGHRDTGQTPADSQRAFLTAGAFHVIYSV